MGGLGIGGGIYGNPFQVNQLSQPPMMQGGSGLMRSPFNPMGQGQPMPPGGQLFNQMNQAQQMPLMGRVSQMDLMNQMNQGQQMPLMGRGQPMLPGGQLFNQMNQMSSPFRSPPASMLQGQGAMLNQPMNMQAGLGSLIPGKYAASI
jgi:hypothetical protein